jgi:hypothetical protein
MSAFPVRALFESLEAAPVYFRYTEPKTHKVLVDSFTASAVLTVYRAANADNQAKLARMVAGSIGQFQRVAAFAFKCVK